MYVHIMRIRKMLISYVKLDHTLYWINSHIFTFLLIHWFPMFPQFLELDFMPNPLGPEVVLPLRPRSSGAIPQSQPGWWAWSAPTSARRRGSAIYAYANNRIIDYKFPYIMTVFSASNYCGTHGNKAAVMVFYQDNIHVHVVQVSAVLEMLWLKVWNC